MTAWRKLLGQQGERMAERHLEKKGYRIIDRNIRSRFGEMDLIAIDGETLVFCEVRSRGGRCLTQAAESIGANKQRRLIRLAEAYLQERPELADHACRFDAVLLQKDGEQWSIAVIQDAFRPGW
jgi:putative endonuclease